MNDELRSEVKRMRVDAQSSFGAGVEGMVSEIRRHAAAAEGAIGEVSIDEAFLSVGRVVVERIAALTGKSHADVIAWLVSQLR